MRVVVTGVAGFVGSHLAEALLNTGDEVVGIDAFIPYYPREVKERNLLDLLDRRGFTFRELDLRADQLDEVLDGADAVVHEAAMAGLMRSWTDLPLYAGCNLLGTQRLLEQMAASGVPRIVHISTSSVYGELAVGDETLPTEPVSPYGITKLAAEKLVSAYARRHGIEPVILRYFSIYGPRQRPDMAYHIFARQMIEGRPITIYGDGHQSRSNTYVSDCVNGTLLALREAPVGIYNLGGGVSIELLDALAIIAEELGVTPRIEHRPARPGDQRVTAADCAAAAGAFGYEPRVAPDDGLRRQVAWHLRERLRPSEPTTAGG